MFSVEQSNTIIIFIRKGLYPFSTNLYNITNDCKKTIA